MKLIQFIFALILIVFSAITHSQEDIIPLTVGNYWKFQNTQGEIEYTKVLEKININGETWYKYREFSDENTFVVKNTEKGHVEIDIESKEVFLVLKYPVTKESIYQQFGNKTRVKPNQPITVPTGTYKAYLYDFALEEPEKNIQMWLVPGIGPVKSIANDKVYELIEYKIQ